jgi:hypothetical protein
MDFHKIWYLGVYLSFADLIKFRLQSENNSGQFKHSHAFLDSSQAQLVIYLSKRKSLEKKLVLIIEEHFMADRYTSSVTLHKLRDKDEGAKAPRLLRKATSFFCFATEWTYLKSRPINCVTESRERPWLYVMSIWHFKFGILLRTINVAFQH